MRGPFIDVALLVPSYPKASEGALWLLQRVISNGMGEPLKDPVLFPLRMVEPGTAKVLGRGYWTGDAQVMPSCHNYGRAELVVARLNAQGVRATAAWKIGSPVALPPGSEVLDQVVFQVDAAAC